MPGPCVALLMTCTPGWGFRSDLKDGKLDTWGLSLILVVLSWSWRLCWRIKRIEGAPGGFIGYFRRNGLCLKPCLCW